MLRKQNEVDYYLSPEAEHDIDERISIYFIHESNISSIKSLSPHITTPSLNNYLENSLHIQEQEFLEKLANKKSRKTKEITQ